MRESMRRGTKSERCFHLREEASLIDGILRCYLGEVAGVDRGAIQITLLDHFNRKPIVDFLLACESRKVDCGLRNFRRILVRC